MKPALAILTTKPHPVTIEFLRSKKLNSYFEVYLVCDCEETVYAENITVVQIAEEFCKKNGYKNSMYIKDRTHIQKEVVALDKALYFFCEVQEKPPQFLWIIEEDVFIPSVEAIISLDKKCLDYDLCITSHKCKTDNVMDWLWPQISKQLFGIIPRPWHYSMACAVRVSRELLGIIREHAREDKTLFFNEVMFNTLANYNNLSVFTPPELKSIVWQGEFSIDDIMLLPGNLFHPKKEATQHAVIRHCLKIIKGKGYVPVNKLPMFLRENLNETEE